MTTTKTCLVEGCSLAALPKRSRCAAHERRWRNAGLRGSIARPQALVALALEAVAATLESEEASRNEQVEAAAVLPALLDWDRRLRDGDEAAAD